MNGFTHHYHLGDSTLIFRGFRCDFKILFNLSMEFLFKSKHLGLYCLPMSYKKDARLIRVKNIFFFLHSSLSYDVAVFQWITSCHKNRMTTRVLTLLREYVTSLTTSVTIM